METSLAQKRAAVCSITAQRLFSLVCDIIATSPDRSCYASERYLAKSLQVRKQTVHDAKWELIAAGALCLTPRENGNRKNPRHRLSLPTNEPRKRRSIVTRGDPCLRDAVVPWYGLGVWADAPRMDLIEFYLKSGLDITALVHRQKRPINSKAFWSRLTFAQKLDTFHHDPTLGVGLWLDDRFEVFDLDSDRIEPPSNTLVSVRGPHSHVFFEASGEVYSTVRKCAPDIDTKGPGSLVCLPPTLHENGEHYYQWSSLVPPKPVSADYLALWRQRKLDGPGTGFKLMELPERIGHGQRNSVLWSYGRALRAAGADRHFIGMKIRQLNLERCKPPFPSHEIERQIKHICEHKNVSDPKRWKEREAVA